MDQYYPVELEDYSPQLLVQKLLACKPQQQDTTFSQSQSANVQSSKNSNIGKEATPSRDAKPLMLFGASGSGKSTLIASLAQLLTAQGYQCLCLSADPGSPAFGTPGAICLGRWNEQREEKGKAQSAEPVGSLEHHWQLLDYESLCSLDAARFRLPLVNAVRRLAERAPPGVLLIDAPGVVQAIAGAELLTGLIEATKASQVCYLISDTANPSLIQTLATLDCDLITMASSPHACRPVKTQRRRQRTKLWRHFLEGAEECTLAPASILQLGIPPKLDDWMGRQLALMRGRETLALGEVKDTHGRESHTATHLALRLVANPVQVKNVAEALTRADSLLVRDAVCSAAKGLHTKPQSVTVSERKTGAGITLYNPDNLHNGEPLDRYLSNATASMVNGVFGDPLLHVNLYNHKRSLLFDLGDAGRLPTRIIHRVSDIFISHTHIDHIGGFLWLLRSRIGYYGTCRMFGPPGLARQVAGLVAGVLWDRVEDRAPCFEVAELHINQEKRVGQEKQVGQEKPDYHLQRWQVVAGQQIKRLGDQPVTEGLILQESGFSVRAAILDHGTHYQGVQHLGTQVLAYGLELAPRFHVDKQKLAAFGVSPGAWLQMLKHRLNEGDHRAAIVLPDDRVMGVTELAEQLLHRGDGEKMVYATDFGNTEQNRKSLIQLAADADLFFCESSFRIADEHLATCNGHLTTRACGEIASLAQVRELVPFHFSKRYEREPEQVYDEIALACSVDIANSFMPVKDSRPTPDGTGQPLH